MREHFPEFSLSGLPLGTGLVAVWKGKVRPVRSAEYLGDLLDDIFHGRPVMMLAGGVVEHHQECAARHCNHGWMEKVLSLFRSTGSKCNTAAANHTRERALTEAADYAPHIGLTLPRIDRFQVPHHGSRRNVSTEILDRWLGERLPTRLLGGQAKFHG
jgi:hypothetical protein